MYFTQCIFKFVKRRLPIKHIYNKVGMLYNTAFTENRNHV